MARVLALTLIFLLGVVVLGVRGDHVGDCSSTCPYCAISCRLRGYRFGECPVLRLHPIAVFVATNRRSALAMLFTKIFTILQTPQFDHSCTFVFYYIQTPSLDAICILIIDCLKQLPLLMTQIVKICFINKDFGGDCKMSFIIIRWCKNSSNN